MSLVIRTEKTVGRNPVVLHDRVAVQNYGSVTHLAYPGEMDGFQWKNPMNIDYLRVAPFQDTSICLKYSNNKICFLPTKNTDFSKKNKVSATKIVIETTKVVIQEADA